MKESNIFIFTLRQLEIREKEHLWGKTAVSVNIFNCNDCKNDKNNC